MTSLRPAQFDEIKLVWRPKPHTDRLVVGSLRRSRDSFEFDYDGPDLTRAKEQGFSGYPGLPLAAGPFGSQAMAAFAARTPSPARTDYAALLGAWDAPAGADPFDILGLTGGRLPTDMFEFIPVVLPIKGTEFLSNLAGLQHYAESEAFRDLPAGTPLQLRPNPDNPHDSEAVQVLYSGNMVAHVKKIHSAAIARALSDGLLVDCTLDRALVNGIIREVLVRIRFE